MASTNMFYADILDLLLEFSDIRTIVNVGRSSVENYSALVDMMKRHRRAGNTILYPRQVAAIDEITAKIAAGERKILFAAPMSFGKTLVAIELARAHMAAGAVFIVIPASIEVVWKKELTRFYPKLMGKGKIDTRTVLFATPKLAAQRAYVAEMAATPSLLRGRIIITNTYACVVTKAASLVIKDECHLNKEATDVFMKRHKHIPCVSMGASEAGVDAERVSFQDTFLAIPEVDDQIIAKSPTNNTAVNLVKESKASHIVLALPSAGDAADVIARLANHRAYDYTTRSVRVLDTFTRDGGVLVTSIRMIAEGNNFNKCAHMIIILPFTRGGADALISLRRIQQVRNRICRQSSNHTKVTVTYVSDHATMLARALLARTDSIGYEIVERANLAAIIQKILPMYKALSSNELITLLAAPVETTYSYSSAAPTLTLAEFIAIANM